MNTRRLRLTAPAGLFHLACQPAAAAAARPDQFMDPSFVERISASGYVEQVRDASKR